jgi:hypothetical protein
VSALGSGGGRGLVRTSNGLQRMPRGVINTIDNAEYNGLLANVRINARAMATGLAIVQVQNLTGLQHTAAALDPEAGDRARALVDAFTIGSINDISRL